jgi:hypothetical protein
MKAIKNFLGAIVIVLILTLIDREIGEEQEPMQKKNTGKWILFCVLSVALLGLMNKCLLAQQVDSVKVSFGMLPPQFAGITTCDSATNRPEITVALGVTGEMLIVILRHEKVHAIRMLRFPGGCNAFQARYTKDFRFRVTEEATAYCSSEYQIGKGIEMRRYWLDKITTIVFEQAGRFVMSYTETKALVAYKCGAPYAPP